ncbi:hypothetical protein [Halosimplex halophilum]|uniref:hypothetical protein n=1 Tax=Halosimplex halophilum TaxID=2559572 RepID=UPI00107FBB29|nr:hypothetical protein [Halosimplex halophilum]
MSDFETSASVDIEITDESLAEARRVIERELGDVGGIAPRPVTDGGGAGAGGRGMRRISSELQDQSDYLAEISQQDQRRNMLLEELLESGPGGGLAGGGGGGGGGLGGIWGTISDTLGNAGEAGGAAALTGAASALGTSATALSGAAAALAASGGIGALEELLGSDSVGVKKPEWVPLPVTEPDPIPVDMPSSEIPVEDPEVDVSVAVSATGRVGGGGGGGDDAPSGPDSIGDHFRNFVSNVPGGEAFANWDQRMTHRAQELYPFMEPNVEPPGGENRSPTGADLSRIGESTNRQQAAAFQAGSGGAGPAESGASTTVSVTNHVDVGTEQREVERIVEEELDQFENRLERKLSNRR